jgi:hypothetical protein
MTEQKAKPAKRPDNNKRLAILESNVSALAIALTANGVALEPGADPFQAAIDVIKSAASLRACNTELETRIAAREAELEAYMKRIAALETPSPGAGTPGTDAAELEELRKRVKELEEENKELRIDVDDLANAKNALANRLAEEGKGTGGEPPPADPVPDPINIAALPAERPEAARDVGPAFKSLSEVAIGKLAAEGGQFEIAFSNGEYEILDFAPVKIAAKDLHRVDSLHFIVGPAVNIRGGHAPARIHGAGLLYGGEQVAYCAFEPPIIIQPGQERRFDRALIFG